MINGSSITIITSENTSCDVYINSLLKEKLQKQIPERRENLANFKNIYKDKIVDTIKAEQVVGGMRDIKSLYWDTSLLDANEGIKFNKLKIEELISKFN